MIRFEIRRWNEWMPVDRGTILASGALMWFIGDSKNSSPIGHWRLAASTINDPVFKQACRDKLSREESELAKYRQFAQAG